MAGKRWVVAIALIGPLACTSFGAEVTPASIPVLANEAGVPEAGAVIPPDASVDGPAARFCASSTFTMCTDFDGAPTGEWQDDLASEVAVGAGSSKPVDTAGKRDVGMGTVLLKGGNDAAVGRRFVRAGSGDLRVEADVFLEDPDTAHEPVNFLGINFSEGNGNVTVTAMVGAKGPGQPAYIALYARSPGGNDETDEKQRSVVIPYAIWVHVTLEGGMTGNGEVVSRVTADPGGTIESPPGSLMRGNVEKAETVVFAGLQRVQKTTPKDIVVRYDNLFATPF